MTSALAIADDGRPARTEVARFDTLDPDRATALLLSCCPNPRWAREVVAGRPYGSMRRLLTAAEDVLADLADDDIERCGHMLTGQSEPAGPDAREQVRKAVRRSVMTTLR